MERSALDRIKEQEKNKVLNGEEGGNTYFSGKCEIRIAY